MAETPSRADPESVHRMLLRLPAELAERVRAAAERDRRSMNAEVLCLIESALDSGDALQAAIAHLPGFWPQSTAADVEHVRSMGRQGLISEDLAASTIAQLEAGPAVAG